jgi:hypothetical protein
MTMHALAILVAFGVAAIVTYNVVLLVLERTVLGPSDEQDDEHDDEQDDVRTVSVAGGPRAGR